MNQSKTWIECIEERISVRTFDNRNLKSDDFDKLNVFITDCLKETNTPIKFKILNCQTDEHTNQKFGTYGFISGTNNFIVGIIDKNNTDPVEFGYTMEKVVLYATCLGFGTCWLGGTFNRNQFENVLSLNENEAIGVLVAIGIRKDKQSLMDRTVRYVAKSNQRKPWSELFFLDNFDTPLTKSKLDQYDKVLEMVRIAPSASNKQPWRIIKTGVAYHFYLARTPNYGLLGFDIQMNDIGIAMCHFELSSKELGLNGRWVKDKNVDVIGLEYILSWVITY